jgi:hypothetical protein
VNPYYNPEEAGYVIVGCADYGSYDFEDFLVLEKDGRYYWATDSGCSCFSPFEGLEEDELTEGTPQEILKALADWKGTWRAGPQIDGYESLLAALMDARQNLAA